MLIHHRYKTLEVFKFAEAEAHGLEIKGRHTIIEEWPMRLKKTPGQPGAEEEFEIFRAAGGDGMERYVEWRKKEQRNSDL